MEEIEVRIATIEDTSAIEELSRQLGYPTSVAETARRLNTLLSADDHGVFVALLDGGTVVGWVHVFRVLRVESESFGELGGFVVAEPHRHRGIGRQLLVTAERWSTELGLAQLRVRTRLGREEAHAFYEGMGFTKTKDQRVYDKDLSSGA